MSDLAQLKEQVDATINLADERRYFGASVKYQRALEAEVERLRSLLRVAVDTIEDLATQQEMADPWYQGRLSDIRAALAGEGGET